MKSATFISSGARNVRFVVKYVIFVSALVAASPAFAASAAAETARPCTEINGQPVPLNRDNPFQSPDWVLGSCQMHPIAGYKCVSAACGFGDVLMLPASEEMILYGRDVYADSLMKTHPGDPRDLRRKLISFTPQANGTSGWVAISEVTRNGAKTINVTGVTRFRDSRGVVVPVALISEAQSQDAAQRNFVVLASAAKLTLSFGDEGQK